LPVSIMPMSLKDLGRVMAIENDSFSMPWSESTFRSEIIDNRFAYYIVARPVEGQEIVGYAGAWMLYGETHITTLAVYRLYRRRGIGSLLLLHLLQKALLKGHKRVYLEVRDSNLEARSLYQKFGFEQRGRHEKYYFDEDACIMVRNL